MGFYNEKHVKCGKTIKKCDWCQKEINLKTPHYVLIDMENYISYPIHENCYSEADEICCGDMKDFIKQVQKHYDVEE